MNMVPLYSVINPVSVLTSMHVFVLPALRILSGVNPDDARPSLRLPLTGKVKSRSGRTYMALGRIVRKRSGPAVEPVGSMGSADIYAACRADGVLAVPAAATELSAGQIVEFLPWRANL